ncbi:MlaD family protein [Nocardioides panacisoli]|uniref:MCE family protein n=1 Tax=Nocardioides panacisoli TaxID=627624 RepID=A0ABP7HYW5_9ACTN
MIRGARRALAAVALVAGLGGAAGCGLSLEDVPLPDLVSGPTYTITAEFTDALNLPVDAPVKLDGSTVGQVASVTAADGLADVELELSTSVRLRSTSRAEIRLTSPMGTAFVQLLPGRGGDVLAEGDTLPVAETSTAPDVSDLLSALSTVVTGGSFGDISTIIKQLNVALTGNAGDARQLLHRLDSAVSGLVADLPRVDRLTRSLGRLTSRLRGDLPVITGSLGDLTDLVRSLSNQRAKLVDAMESLNRFDSVATPFTRAVRDDLVAQLDDMRPVLQTLLDNRRNIDGVMAGLVAFAKGSNQAAPGDYANFDLTFLLDPDALQGGQHGGQPPLPTPAPDGRGSR